MTFFAIRILPEQTLGFGTIQHRVGEHVLFQDYAGDKPHGMPQVVHVDEIVEGKFTSAIKARLAIDSVFRWLELKETKEGPQSDEAFRAHLRRFERDNCEVCRGERGGVPGNENVIDGKVVCDYCSIDIMDARKG